MSRRLADVSRRLADVLLQPADVFELLADALRLLADSLFRLFVCESDLRACLFYLSRHSGDSFVKMINTERI